MASTAPEGIKSILLHVQDDDTLSSRVETALCLARAFEAHLSCLHITPFQAYIASEQLGGVFVMDQIMKALDEQEDRLRARIEEDLANEGVSWDYEQRAGEIAPSLAGYSALADLIVTGRRPHRSDVSGPWLSVLGNLLHLARSPLLIPGDSSELRAADGTVMIAWDGGFEAAAAVRAACPLLKAASSVEVVRVEEEKKDQFPATQLMEYLSRHGIRANLEIVSPAGAQIADALLGEASNLGANMIVMGGYGRSRFREFVFGGVTRTLLVGCPLPLVVSR